MSLYNNKNYIIDQNIIIGRNIYEYDISKANISSLLAQEIITQEEFNRIALMNKYDREVYIGYEIRKDHRFVEYISNGITLAKKALFEINQLKDENVIRIANDAVYYMDIKPLKYNVVPVAKGYMEFKLKNIFTSMMKLPNNMIIFYKGDNNGYLIDVKGIKDELLYLHQPFISFLCELFEVMEYGDKDAMIYKFNSFYEKYIKKELSIDYYREFKNSSSFKIINSRFGCTYLDQSHINEVDISYNLNILRIIYSYIISL